MSTTAAISVRLLLAKGCSAFMQNKISMRTLETIRGTEEWDSTYKIRVNAEKSITHVKYSSCAVRRKTQNEKILHSDLLPTRIAQLITVMAADKLH